MCRFETVFLMRKKKISKPITAAQHSAKKTFGIKLSGGDYVLEKLRAKTGLTKDQCRMILTKFFETIRVEILNGNRIILKEFGSFFMSSPVTTKNSLKVFPKFKPSKKLLQRLNEK